MVAQLLEQLIMKGEICHSNPVISNSSTIFFADCRLAMKIKDEAKNDPKRIKDHVYTIRVKVFQMEFKFSVSSKSGEVHIRYSVVQSPCGNVIHTLINTRDYKIKQAVPFLPGFVDVVHEGEIYYLSV